MKEICKFSKNQKKCKFGKMYLVNCKFAQKKLGKMKGG